MAQFHNKARTAFFIPSLNCGGAERVMVSLANGFAERGLLVDLVLVTAAGAYLSEVNAKVRIVDLKGKRVLTSLLPLTNYLRREKPAVMLSAMNYANVVAIWARFFSGSGTSLAVSEHAALSQIGDIKGFIAKVLPWIMKKSYPKADVVIAVSNGVADDLVKNIGLPRNRITALYNPIETLALVKKSREPFKHPWFAEGQPPVIIGAGRLSKEKDFPTLISAFERLRETVAARLVILGEGAERPALELFFQNSQYRHDILLAGFQKNPYNWMRHSAVFVLSSRWEGFGNVLVEAMACGTPVISTACPSGPDEILENGKWGQLVPVGDVQALAKALENCLTAKNHPDVAARANEFNVDNAIDAYLKVLRV